MRAPRTSQLTRAAIVAAIMACCGAAALAQQEAEEQDREDENIEEIVVVAHKSGDPIDIEANYEALLRSRLMQDLEQLRNLEEDYEWRKTAGMSVENPTRIKWGYDPDDELSMRRETDLMDVQFVTTRPATLFRAEF